MHMHIPPLLRTAVLWLLVASLQQVAELRGAVAAGLQGQCGQRGMIGVVEDTVSHTPIVIQGRAQQGGQRGGHRAVACVLSVTVQLRWLWCQQPQPVQPICIPQLHERAALAGATVVTITAKGRTVGHAGGRK
eukprot:scaffold105575_cov21-Tisochrysis_lutea.AAC.1